MQDKLKKYVAEHREEFEQHTPPEYLWYGVGERLQQGRKDTLWWRRLAIAASVFLVLTCGTWIFVANRHNTVSETTVQAQPEIMKAEAYFAVIMQKKDAELKQYCGPQPELCREFKRDLETLNEAYIQLKKEYAISADKNAILPALTANLQQQLQLIDLQLQIMEAVKQKKSELNII